MKGMTNNQIIMNEAAKLDPATLHAIATAHHTPEQIAAMAANAVTTDENGDEQPATIADVEIVLAAAELHTFDHWKKEGKSVKKGETHLIECYLWKYTTRPSKAQREAAEAEGKEAAPAPHFYPTKSHLFSCLQVHDAKQAPAGRFGSVAAIIVRSRIILYASAYQTRPARERRTGRPRQWPTAFVPGRIEQGISTLMLRRTRSRRFHAGAAFAEMAARSFTGLERKGGRCCTAPFRYVGRLIS